MKWSSIFSASALVASVFASPVYPVTRDADQRYLLRVSSNTKELDGTYLSIRENLLGIYAGGRKQDAQKVFYNTVQSTHSVILRTWPIGIVDHALGLTGDHSYLDLTDITMPREGSQDYSWMDFKLIEAHNGEKKLLWHKEAKPGWIAAPNGGDGQYRVKNFDSEKGDFAIQDYIPIQIVLEPVAQHS